MNENNVIEDTTLQSVIAGLIGKTCCRQRVGRMCSLSLGFGSKIPHGKPRLADDFYGEWEIGTYSAEWSIVQGDAILFSSRDFAEESLLELDEKLNKIPLGKIEALDFISKAYIRMQLNGGIHIDFLASDEEDEDEFFHVFCPDNIFIACSLNKGWFIERP
jgi:hypothetical protein